MRIAEMIAQTAPCPCCSAQPEWNSNPNFRDGPLCREVFDRHDREVGYAISCLSCDLLGPFGNDEKSAIESWNQNARYISEQFAPAAKLLKAVQFAGFKREEAA